MTGWLDPGSKAPDFTLPAQDGAAVRLSALRGRPVVLYFYPEDGTPGCTKQACAFREASGDLQARGAIVLGVSPDDVDSHRAFSDEHRLPFALLADPERRVLMRYGAWREKFRYGRKFIGVQRSTYLIDPRGRVFKVWKSVRVAGHEQRVLVALDAMLSASADAAPPLRKRTTSPRKRPKRS